MKILTEADIFQGQEGYNRSELNKASGDDRFDMIIDLLKTKYGPDDYVKYINTADSNSNILDLVVSSIDKLGSDTTRNKSVLLLDELINSKAKELDREAFQLASLLLQSNKIEFESNRNWLLDDQSYKPLYKAKVLAFLNTPDAKSFGDNIAEAKRDISEMTDETEIKNYMSNWQTKSGPEANDGTPGSEYLLDYLGVMSFRTTDTPVNELKKFIKSSREYLELTDKTVLDNYMDDNQKVLEKILSLKYANKDAFNNNIARFIRDNSK